MRKVIGSAGILLGLFGVFRLVTQVPLADLVVLAVWLVGALIVHDGILSPVVGGIATLLDRVPARARRYLQGGLVTGALITVVAIPLILRQDTQPRSKGILQQDYAGNLAILLGVVAAVTLAAYAVRVARRKP